MRERRKIPAMGGVCVSHSTCSAKRCCRCTRRESFRPAIDELEIGWRGVSGGGVGCVRPFVLRDGGGVRVGMWDVGLKMRAVGEYVGGLVMRRGLGVVDRRRY